MISFKPGDVVLCVANESHRMTKRLVVGQLYTIAEAENTDGWVMIKGEHYGTTFWSDYFVLASGVK